jgi:pimeloyl-ACP methyl ester carboxylesterase
MNNLTRQHRIVTSHGSIAVEETGRGDVPVLFIHGNSSCRGVFRISCTEGSLKATISLLLIYPAMAGRATRPILRGRRHGQDWQTPTIELLEKLGIERPIVFGWSLGGHIAIEMISRFSGMQGMITDSPPVAHNNMGQGFSGSPSTGLAGKPNLSEADTEAFLRAICADSVEPFVHEAVERADFRFHRRLFEAARAGEGVDQRQMLESSPIPLAVVNGAADPNSEPRFLRLCQSVGRLMPPACRFGHAAVLGGAG